MRVNNQEKKEKEVIDNIWYPMAFTQVKCGLIFANRRPRKKEIASFLAERGYCLAKGKIRIKPRPIEKGTWNFEILIRR